MPVADHDIHYLEIVSDEVERTRELLSRAHGWSFGEPQPDLGNAVVAELPGGSRCGIRAPMSPEEQPIVRTYLRVDDVDAEARRAVEHGAMLALAPTQLGAHGTIAIYFIGGIQQGIWQLP